VNGCGLVLNFFLIDFIVSLPCRMPSKSFLSGFIHKTPEQTDVPNMHSLFLIECNESITLAVV
jgi:hypothetical protein